MPRFQRARPYPTVQSAIPISVLSGTLSFPVRSDAWKTMQGRNGTNLIIGGDITIAPGDGEGLRVLTIDGPDPMPNAARRWPPRTNLERRSAGAGVTASI